MASRQHILDHWSWTISGAPYCCSLWAKGVCHDIFTNYAFFSWHHESLSVFSSHFSGFSMIRRLHWFWWFGLDIVVIFLDHFWEWFLGHSFRCWNFNRLQFFLVSVFFLLCSLNLPKLLHQSWLKVLNWHFSTSRVLFCVQRGYFRTFCWFKSIYQVISLALDAAWAVKSAHSIIFLAQILRLIVDVMVDIWACEILTREMTCLIQRLGSIREAWVPRHIRSFSSMFV